MTDHLSTAPARCPSDIIPQPRHDGRQHAGYQQDDGQRDDGHRAVDDLGVAPLSEQTPTRGAP